MARGAWGRKALWVALALGTPPGGALAAEADKSRFNFFNPTPNSLLREFGTDRPSITTGPFTVDAGRVQIETDFVNYTRSRPDEDGTVTEKFLFGATVVRVGITNDVELSALLQPFNALRTRTLDPFETVRKFGPDALQLRAKINLYGNDSYKDPGNYAFGIVPFVNLPTVRNGVGPEDVEGGVILPIALKLSDKADFTAMTAFEAKKNELGSGYHIEYVNSGTVAYQFTDKWITYGEVATRFNNEGPFGGIVVVGGGFQYKLSENSMFDFGANFGLTRASDRFNPFVGYSRRFAAGN